ncbi:GNVR domain-containing protein [soil metagenome]
MDETEKSLTDYLAIFRRRKLLIGITAGSLFALSVLVAFGLPAIYRSSATILIEAQEIPSDLVRSTITSFADQQIQVITQRVMTTQNLSGIITKFDLYAEDRPQEPLSELVERLKEDIELEVISADVVDPMSGRPTQATIAFTLSFDSKSPALAQDVANELVSLYLNENLRSRTESAAETSEFLAGEVVKLDEEIGALEKRIAQFKRENEMRLPELTELNLQLMERADRELAEVDRALNQIESNKIFLQSQLAIANPTMSMVLATGEPVVSPEDQLRALRTQRSRLQSIYGSEHPDVRRVKREIAALEQEVGGPSGIVEIDRQLAELRAELEAAQGRYGEEHPDVVRLERQIGRLEQDRIAAAEAGLVAGDTDQNIDPNSNPAFVSLLTQLRAAEAEQKSLLAQRERLEKKLTAYEQRIFDTPQVEAEYSELTREFENKRLEYQETLAKQLQAERARTLEQERMGERFILIEPPLEPDLPHSPNRIAILLLGMVLSVAGGFGSAVVAESVDSSVRGPYGVEAITGARPIAQIPMIPTELEHEGKSRRKAMVGAAAAGAVGTLLLVVHAFIKPLDVIWFVAMRKLGG